MTEEQVFQAPVTQRSILYCTYFHSHGLENLNLKESKFEV